MSSCICVLDEVGWHVPASVAGRQWSTSAEAALLLEAYPSSRFALAGEPNHRCRAYLTWRSNHRCDSFLHWIGQTGVRRKFFCQTFEGSAIWDMVPTFGACPLPGVRWSVKSPLTPNHEAQWRDVLVVFVTTQRGLLPPGCADCWHNGCASGNLRGPLRTV